MSTRYTTHSKFTSMVNTEVTYPNDRQITNSYDALYRRNAINETSGDSSIAAWQFSGPGRTVELVLGNGLIATQMNNARTHSALQSSLAIPRPRQVIPKKRFSPATSCCFY